MKKGEFSYILKSCSKAVMKDGSIQRHVQWMDGTKQWIPAHHVRSIKKDERTEIQEGSECSEWHVEELFDMQTVDGVLVCKCDWGREWEEDHTLRGIEWAKESGGNVLKMFNDVRSCV